MISGDATIIVNPCVIASVCAASTNEPIVKPLETSFATKEKANARSRLEKTNIHVSTANAGQFGPSMICTLQPTAGAL